MAQSFFPTAQVVIDAALRVIRAIDPEGGVAPTTTQRTNALEAFNFLVTSWQAKGMQVWCTKTATLTLTSGQSIYKLTPSGGDLAIARPSSISQAWLHNISANTDPVPLQIIGREIYNSFTSKASTATPNSVWYDPTYDLPASNSGANAWGTLHVYPTPSATEVATYTLQFVYTRPIQDFSTVSDSLDFPPEWANAVKWNLAAQLSYEYGVPVMYIDRIEKRAENELESVMGWDRETGSMYLQIDTTGGQNS